MGKVSAVHLYIPYHANICNDDKKQYAAMKTVSRDRYSDARFDSAKDQVLDSLVVKRYLHIIASFRWMYSKYVCVGPLCRFRMRLRSLWAFLLVGNTRAPSTDTN